MEREKIKHDLLTAEFNDVQSETLSHIFAAMASKDDIGDLRTEMRGEFRAVRSEMASEFKAVRSEMAGEFKAVRSEMASEFQAVRSEMASEFQAVRSEMAGEFRAVRGEMKEMESRMVAAIEISAALVRQEIAESARDTMRTIAEFQNKLFMLMLALVGALATVFTMLDIFID